MDSSQERVAKLAAAKKKLKKFKSKKAAAAPSDCSENEEIRIPTPTIPDTEVKGIPNTFPTPPGMSGPVSMDTSSLPLAVTAESSAVESILQLSSQLTGLLESNGGERRRKEEETITNGFIGGRQSPIGGNNEVEILQSRNRDLADKVRQLQQKNNQLTRNINIQAEHVTSLEKQLNTTESETTNKLRLEVQHTKEQLQVHIQTIGILVDEKQTLQGQLNNLQRGNNSKSAEIEDLTARLTASRLRVSELEKTTSKLRSERRIDDKHESDRLKNAEKIEQQLNTLRQEYDDVKEQRVQLEQQLHNKLTVNSELEGQVAELQAKLGVSQAYLQQITNGDSEKDVNLYSQQIDELKDQNQHLHLTVNQLQDSLQSVTAERNQTVEQYAQIISSLQHEGRQLDSRSEDYKNEISKLGRKIEDLQHENNNLQTQLEDTLSSSDQSDDSVETQIASQPAAQPDTQLYSQDQVAGLVQQYEQLRLQYEALYKNCEILQSDNQHLTHLLTEYSSKYSDLETSLDERLESERNASRRVVASHEGDKSALSRALTQNRQLKQQQELIEQRFVRMSEDLMASQTELQSEQHKNSQLTQRLEDSDKQLTQSLQYISAHEDQLKEVGKMSHQQQQLLDRMRHYEAQIQVVSTLQQELDSSQQLVNSLSHQNSQLRQQVIDLSQTRQHVDQHQENSDQTADEPVGQVETSLDQSNQPAETSDQAQVHSAATIQSNPVIPESVQSALSQLESEKSALSERCDQLLEENRKLSVFLSQGDEDLRSLSELRQALDALQSKFTRVMGERAELQDITERLEYENLHLQAETETINEYITIYHQQREVIKQRAHQYHVQAQTLISDRDKILSKFSQLQSLVVHLLNSPNMAAVVNVNSMAFSPIISVNKQERSDLRPEENHMESEMWPDYESNSDESEVEAIINQSDISQEQTDQSDPPADSIESNASSTRFDQSDSNIPPPDQQITHHPYYHSEEQYNTDEAITARRILSLLSDIRSDTTPTSLDFTHIVNCSHCHGPVVAM